MNEEIKMAIIRVKHCTLDLKSGKTKEHELKGKELEKWIKENITVNNDDTDNNP